jgi:hypothetical protein
MKQTAVEWLVEQINNLSIIDPAAADLIQDILEYKEQAKAMEKEQMDKVAGDWWNEGASYMHDGGRKYKNFEQYYNETFKSE